MANKTPEEYLKEPYARILIPDETGVFSAEVLELPGCYAIGSSPDEALANLEDVAKTWIEIELERGHEIPPPSANHEYSGRFALRLPRSLHRLATRMAKQDGTSLNQFLVSAIAARVGAEDLYNRIADRASMLVVHFVGADVNFAITEPSQINRLSEGGRFVIEEGQSVTDLQALIQSIK